MGINVDQPQKKERVEWLDVVEGIIIDQLLNSYVLPELTKNMSLNYAAAFGETVVVMVICVAGNWLIRRFSFTSKLFLGNRTE